MISRELIVCAISFYEELISKMIELLRCFTPGTYYFRQNGMYPQHMLHTEDDRFLYIHNKNRAVAREQALKKDLQERLTDYMAQRDFWKKALEKMDTLPHAQKDFEANEAVRKLLDEAFELLKNNGTFFTEDEWWSLIKGDVDQQFWEIANNDYKKIIPAERRRLRALNRQGVMNDFSDRGELFFAHHPDSRAAQIADRLNGAEFDKEVRTWLTQDYIRNQGHPENLRYTAWNGEKMRSKLEMLTAQILNLLGIPYHYEQQLVLGDRIYYPDFTLMLPRTHRIVYLEIFGMMSDPKYAQDTGRKLLDYSSHGLVIGQNLLCYTETNEEPLDFEKMRMDLEYMLQRG